MLRITWHEVPQLSPVGIVILDLWHMGEELCLLSTSPFSSVIASHTISNQSYSSFTQFHITRNRTIVTSRFDDMGTELQVHNRRRYADEQPELEKSGKEEPEQIQATAAA